MNGKINIALVGAGGIGKRWVKALNNVEKVNLTIIVDKDTKRAEEVSREYKKGNCEIFENYKQVVDRENIDAVIIATPHKFLASISEDFLSNHKHVLSEKPCGVSTEEIKKLANLSKENDLRYMAGFNHRFHEGFILARKLFEEGKIGDIQFIRANYGFGGRKEIQNEWRFDKDMAGGGELIDQGIHMIDMVRSFVGEIKEVKGFAENLYWKGEVDDNAFVLLKSEDGQVASIHVSWSNWKPTHTFEIFGTNGYMIVSGLGRKYGDGERVILGIRDNEYSWEPKEEIFECNPEADMSLAREVEEFVEAIYEKREPVPNVYDAVKAMDIVEKVYNN